MNENQPAIPDKLRLKFPHLQAIKGPPSLMTINGFGVSVYGKRDFDAETQTYIKTRWLCALYVPLFALDAYRVANAGARKWYFLGKESLSGFARSWNMGMAGALVLLALAIGWNVHTSSPEYRARQEIKQASALIQAGKPLEAAGIYRRQLNGPLAVEARAGFQSAFGSCLQSDNTRTIVAAFHLLAALPAEVNQPAPLAPDAFKRGLALVEKFRTTSPEAALDILNAAAGLDSENPSIPPLRIGLLKQIVAANPDDTKRVVELAVAYENAGQLPKSWKLLGPYQDRLGTTEGARILGQRLLQEQNYTEAYKLLFPYVQVRLSRLHTIEVTYSNKVAAIGRRAINDLNAGRADHSFYTAYKNASKEKRDEMVDNYIETQMKTSPGYQRALTELKEANRIVPVTLDLGIVQLNRAQELKDAAARKKELEAAEKTFLAIRSFAGGSDEYQLYLGQVYYWLGKSKEGRDLFDQLLARRQRAYAILMSISQTLRAVGDTASARSLVEEAYAKANSPRKKYAAAALRSLLSKDQDDQIAWLQKADPNSAWVQIELNGARGRKALQQGDKTRAAELLRKAISGYAAQPKTSSSLNNQALVCFDLYTATGDAADQQHGMALLEEAVALDPGDSILLYNTMHFLINQAVIDVNHNAIKIGALHEQPRLRMLSDLYQNEQERARVYQRLHEDEAMKKGLAYLDKALLLAPKDPNLYSTALSIYGSFRDVAELRKLQQRFHIAAPDLTETRQETLKAYTNANDKENLAKYEKQIQELADLTRRPAINQDPLTLEYANVTLNELRQNAWICGGKIDSRKLLQSALATWQKHHSSASCQALQSAYFFRANEELAQENPDYAAMVAKTRHAIAPELLITFTLERGGSLAALARKNENVIKAIALEKETVKNFPLWDGVEEWAMLRNTDPETAALVASKFKANQVLRLMGKLQFQIDPWSASEVLNQYWTQKLLGDDQRATATYQAAVKSGVPLPPL